MGNSCYVYQYRIALFNFFVIHNKGHFAAFDIETFCLRLSINFPTPYIVSFYPSLENINVEQFPPNPNEFDSTLRNGFLVTSVIGSRSNSFIGVL